MTVHVERLRLTGAPVYSSLAPVEVVTEPLPSIQRDRPRAKSVPRLWIDQANALFSWFDDDCSDGLTEFRAIYKNPVALDVGSHLYPRVG